MTARYIVGDTREVTASLPDGSVDLVLTSPPFLALRSYLPDDHPSKHLEIGSEATPADFLDVLLDLTEEWARVLAPHGSIVVELGDTYAGSGGAGGDYANDGLRAGQQTFRGSAHKANTTRYTYGEKDGGRVGTEFSATQVRNGGGRGWPLDKSLCGIPHLYHLSLAYGRNLLRPERLTDPWRVRNVIAWCRPNPPVGALGDKFRPATSYMTVATKARDRWFDLDAVRGEPSPNTHARTAKGVESRPRSGKSADRDGNWSTLPELAETQGAPPLDWWNISTEPYAGSHYATWPRKLLTRPILAMCPERVCTTCGQPSRRIVDIEPHGEWRRPELDHTKANHGGPGTHGDRTRKATTLGWTDCGHGTWRPGVVLDVFGGSGTTGAVATGHGRNCVLVDIDERNADLAVERIGGLFCDVARYDPSGSHVPDWLVAPGAKEDAA